MYSLFKKLLIVFFLIFTVPNFAQENRVMPGNLHDVEFADRQYVIENAKKLLANANRDAYLISMPLIVSAQLGDEDFYQQTHAAMRIAVTNRKNDTFTAWLYGRELLAATSMGNKPEDVSAATEKLKELLEENQYSTDSFRAWALAYLAASNNDAYQKTKEPMLKSANLLLKIYVMTSPFLEKEKQEARSNALWSWVMISLAAANTR